MFHFANTTAIEDRSLVSEIFVGVDKLNWIPIDIKSQAIVAPIASPILPKVSQYAKAEAYHAMHGAAPDNVIAERLKICGGCKFRSSTHEGATDPDNFGWCTKCGCGSNPRALLNNKTKLAKTSCPLSPPLWSEVEGVGGSVASVVDSVKGVAQSIKHLLTGNKDTPPPTN